MKVTEVYKGYGRMGQDWNSGGVFFSSPPSRRDIAHLILDSLDEDKTPTEIHRLTCGMFDVGKKSITGDFYLTKKCIKYKIDVRVEAELVDDEEIIGDIK